MTGQLSRIIRQLREYLRHEEISAVLLGLSGGADSVLAFHLLRLAGKGIPGFRIGIVHVNFMLRDAESLRDEKFVSDLVNRYAESDAEPEIKLTVRRVDTVAYCDNHRVSIEMGARELRHDFFRELAEQGGYERIATGHNADDNEETMLLNLLRGSGSRGLRGMEYDNGRILRPLLNLPRKEILELLPQIPDKKEGEPTYVTDSSNLTDDYRRNFLRHRVLPLLESRWPGTHSVLQATLRIQAEEARIVEASLLEALKDCRDLLSWKKLQAYPSPSTLILRWLEPHGVSPAIALEMAYHIPERGKVCATPGRRWQLPDDRGEVYTSFEGLHLTFTGTRQNNPEIIWSEVTICDENMDEVRKCPPDSAYLPGAPEDYEWRTPMTGDRMKINRRSATKLISDILKEARIPVSERKNIRILYCKQTGEPVWIPGIRRAMTCLIPTDATRALFLHPACPSYTTHEM